MWGLKEVLRLLQTNEGDAAMFRIGHEPVAEPRRPIDEKPSPVIPGRRAAKQSGEPGIHNHRALWLWIPALGHAALASETSTQRGNLMVRAPGTRWARRRALASAGMTIEIKRPWPAR